MVYFILLITPTSFPSLKFLSLSSIYKGFEKSNSELFVSSIVIVLGQRREIMVLDKFLEISTFLIYRLFKPIKNRVNTELKF